MEEQKKINAFVSKCYRCRYSLTNAGTTVKIKAVRGKYENNVKNLHTHRYSSTKVIKGDKSQPRAHCPNTLHV
jgi:DNA-directed RNA polymerase subunit M/transcription elongation factor TFIIS